MRLPRTASASDLGRPLLAGVCRAVQPLAPAEEVRHPLRRDGAKTKRKCVVITEEAVRSTEWKNNLREPGNLPGRLYGRLAGR